jgi:outer membrane protein
VRKIFTRFAVLALVAVVVYSCGEKSDSTGADASSTDGIAAGDLKIAYVHTDSVINKYDFFKKKSAIFFPDMARVVYFLFIRC